MTEPESESRICADCGDECPPEDVVAHPEAAGAYLCDFCWEAIASRYGVHEDDLDPRSVRHPAVAERVED